MDTIRRNIGLVAFCVVSAILAVVLVVLIQRHAGTAREFEGKVEALQKFFDTIRRSKIAVTEESYETVRGNHDRAEQKLGELREALWRRSRIRVGRSTGVECKNILRDETRQMQAKLAAADVDATRVSQFSFGGILDAAALPDEETEVPVILKQLEIMKEIVDLVAQSNVLVFDSVERTLGTRVVKQDYYHVMPLNLSVTGTLWSVKQFATLLQRDTDYLFAVQRVKITGEDLVDSASGRPAAPAAAMPGPSGAGRRGAQRPEFGIPPEMMGFPDGAPRTRPRPTVRRPTEEPEAEAEEPRPLTKEERAIELSQVVRADIRVDFLEFVNPSEGR